MEIKLNGRWDFIPNFIKTEESIGNVHLKPLTYHVPEFIFARPFEGLHSARIKKQFVISEILPPEPVYLCFFGADPATVIFNGKKIGILKKKAGEQSFEIRDLLRSENELILDFEQIEPESIGLWRDVYLISGKTTTALSRTTITHTPAWVDSAVIYSIYTRNFSKKGDFQGIIKRMDYLEELGVNTLWFLPIHPIGKQNRKGALGSPYAIRDYYGINPEYGSHEDFKKLVDEAHKRKMRVIIDLVINHTSPDSEMARKDPRFFKPEEKQIAGVWGWTDVRDLDYDYPPTRRYIQDMMAYWVQEFGIDGYRADVAFLVPEDFWKEAIGRLRSINPDIMMLAESDRPELYAAGFDLTYDWSYLAVLERVEHQYYNLSAIADYIQTQDRFFPNQARRMICTENHDTKRAAEVLKSSLLQMQVLKFLTPGVPLIYNGEEFGAAHTPDLFSKDLVEWDADNIHIFELYKKLIRLKKEYSALQHHDSDNFTVFYEKELLHILRQNTKTRLKAELGIKKCSVKITNGDKTLLSLEK